MKPDQIKKLKAELQTQVQQASKEEGRLQSAIETLESKYDVSGLRTAKTKAQLEAKLATIRKGLAADSLAAEESFRSGWDDFATEFPSIASRVAGSSPDDDDDEDDDDEDDDA